MGWMNGLQFLAGTIMGFVLSITMSRPALEPTQPPNQQVLGAFTPGVKWPGHEADHSLLSGAKVKNIWSYTSTPQYTFMVYLIKQ
jgi:hypothetical protein